MNNGKLIVVSGPSGVGKGTVLHELMARRDDFVYSVSATTRSPRTGEVDGENYFFVTREAFERMIAADELLEYAEYNGNYYGTPKVYVEKSMAAGKNVILEIETQGAFKIRERCPDAVLLFIAPENKDELFSRLKGRGTESEEVIANRLSIAERELAVAHLYDAVVYNRDGKIEECAADIVKIVENLRKY